MPKIFKGSSVTFSKCFQEIPVRDQYDIIFQGLNFQGQTKIIKPLKFLPLKISGNAVSRQGQTPDIVQFSTGNIFIFLQACS